LLNLYQGAKLELSYDGQSRIIMWHGSRVQTAITFTPPASSLGDPGGLPPSFESAILFDVLEGDGRRGGRAQAVAKRAGLNITGNRLPFALVPRQPLRPNPPRDFVLVERNQWEAILRWRASEPHEGHDDPHTGMYALELSVPGASGTYGPFFEIWQGPGDAPLVLACMAPEPGSEPEPPKTTQAVWKGAGSSKDSKDAPPPMATASSTDSAGSGAAETPEGTVFEYILFCDSGLHGRLRLRCWSRGEDRPSVYSNEVKLPRYQGKVETKIDTARQQLEAEREAAWKEIGKPAVSNNFWGEGAAPDIDLGGLDAPKGKKNAFKLPYIVPVPNMALKGIREAGKELHSLYEELGVPGGGLGRCFGLRIDHIMHALVEGDLTSTAETAIMAFIEVAYKDVLLPMKDTVVVLRHEWSFAIEKIAGIIAQMLTYMKHYTTCIPHLKTVLTTLIELYETMRQCEFEMLLALQVADEEHSRGTRISLKSELVDRIITLLWRFSTESLKMQIDVELTREAAAQGGGAGSGWDDGVSSLESALRMQVIAAAAGETLKGKKKVGVVSRMAKWLHIIG